MRKPDEVSLMSDVLASKRVHNISSSKWLHLNLMRARDSTPSGHSLKPSSHEHKSKEVKSDALGNDTFFWNSEWHFPRHRSNGSSRNNLIVVSRSYESVRFGNRTSRASVYNTPYITGWILPIDCLISTFSCPPINAMPSWEFSMFSPHFLV